MQDAIGSYDRHGKCREITRIKEIYPLTPILMCGWDLDCQICQKEPKQSNKDAMQCGPRGRSDINGDEV